MPGPYSNPLAYPDYRLDPRLVGAPLDQFSGVPPDPRGAVVSRGQIVPEVTYEDGSHGFGLPHFITDVMGAKRRLEENVLSGNSLQSPHVGRDNALDAFSVASNLPLGGAAAGVPSNALAANVLNRESKRGRPQISMTPDDRKFVADNYSKMGRDELTEKLGYHPSVYYRELPDILSEAGLEMKVQGTFGKTPTELAQVQARNQAIVQDANNGLSLPELMQKHGMSDQVIRRIVPGIAPKAYRDPELIDFISQHRAPDAPNGQQSMGQIANAWNARSDKSPITRSTVAGIRRDYNIPANMTDPMTGFGLSLTAPDDQPSNALARRY